MSYRKKTALLWLVVCTLPLLTLLWFHLNPPQDRAQILINGIILACEATFLAKLVLFETIKYHLRGEYRFKKQTLLLFVPIALLVFYLFHYFGAW